MKISERISYPYPILGWDDSYKTVEKQQIPTEKLDDADAFIYEMTVVNNDPVIQQLIKEKKAVYACIATCSSTFYNKFVTTNDPFISISISRDDVYGTVELKFMIVATCDIPNYCNENLNDFYEGSAFFPKGAVIALLYEGSFDAVPTSGKTLGDILKVVKNTWDNEITTDVDNDCLRIALPEEEFNVFDTRGASIKAVLHSTIVYNALLIAIDNLPKFKADDSKSEYAWVKYLVNEIEQMDDILNVDDLSEEQDADPKYSIPEAMKIANRILKKPCKRALIEVSTFD